MDTDHWRIPTDLHTGALTGLGGGTDTILGPGTHHVRLPQRIYWPIQGPTQPAVCRSANGVWAGGPHSPLLTALAVTPHEDMVAGAKGHIVEGKV